MQAWTRIMPISTHKGEKGMSVMTPRTSDTVPTV